jgi:hypothetical protein
MCIGDCQESENQRGRQICFHGGGASKRRKFGGAKRAALAAVAPCGPRRRWRASGPARGWPQANVEWRESFYLRRCGLAEGIWQGRDMPEATRGWRRS